LPPATSCVRTGCSGQLCVDLSFKLDGLSVTTCQWQDEFACYQNAICEVQASGRCGFTMTEELRTCLQDFTSPRPRRSSPPRPRP
jgi:hypothetical protein